MEAHLYPALALKTEGTYEYVKNVWRNGRFSTWLPNDGEPGFTDGQLTTMRYEHSVIGINTEASELHQLFVADYLGNLESPLDSMEAVKELGDIMWYVSLCYQASYTFKVITSPHFAPSVPGTVKFADAVNRAREIADGMESRTVPVTLMSLSMSIQHAANLLLKWLKNSLYYGQVRASGDIETQLCLIIAQVARLARLLGSDINKVLEINIDKLKRRYPAGFNGEDAVKQADEAPGYKSISDQPVLPTTANLMVEMDARMRNEAENPGPERTLEEKAWMTNHMVETLRRCEKEHQDRRVGLIIDGTFDQTVLPEPCDRSDLAVLAENEQRDKFTEFLAYATATVATWPTWKRDILGRLLISDVGEINSVVEQVTHEVQPPPALPQADLPSRVRALTDEDVKMLEESVGFIKRMHECHDVVVSEQVLAGHFNQVIKCLGWQPSEAAQPVVPPSQPLS